MVAPADETGDPPEIEADDEDQADGYQLNRLPRREQGCPGERW